MEKDQRLLDYRLSVEYQYLVDNTPAGVMILPEFNNIRVFNGVAFVRTGCYKGGVFRFTMKLPPTYNSVNTFPEVHFLSPVFNPLVDPETGRLTFFLNNEVMTEWVPSKHFLSTALSCVKKIFHTQKFDSIPTGEAPNERARELFDSDRDAFNAEVSSCVQISSSQAIIGAKNESSSSSSVYNTIRFSEPMPAHDFLRETVLGDFLASRERELKLLLSVTAENKAGDNKHDEHGDGDASKGKNKDTKVKQRRDSVVEARDTLTRIRSSSSREGSPCKPDSPAPAPAPALALALAEAAHAETTPKNARKLRSFFDAALSDSPEDKRSPRSP